MISTNMTGSRSDGDGAVHVLEPLHLGKSGIGVFAKSHKGNKHVAHCSVALLYATLVQVWRALPLVTCSASHSHVRPVCILRLRPLL